jgi:hypothetical protein
MKAAGLTVLRRGPRVLSWRNVCHVKRRLAASADLHCRSGLAGAQRSRGGGSVLVAGASAGCRCSAMRTAICRAPASVKCTKSAK